MRVAVLLALSGCLPLAATAQSGTTSSGAAASQAGTASPAAGTRLPAPPTARKTEPGYDATGFWGVDFGRGSDAAGPGAQAVTSVGIRFGLDFMTLRASFDRVRSANGGSIEMGYWLPLPLTCRRQLIQCRDKLVVIPEAVLGHHWGPQFGTYAALGGGIGWAIYTDRNAWPIIPYLEYRRRFSFHSVARGDGQFVAGLLFTFGYWD